MQKQWDKQFKDRLGDYSQSPERDLWPDIEHRLPPNKKERPLILPLWWKTGAVVSAAASLALMLWLLPSDQAGDSNLQLADKSSSIVDLGTQSGSTQEIDPVFDQPIAQQTPQATEEAVTRTNNEMPHHSAQSSASEVISVKTNQDQGNGVPKPSKTLVEKDATRVAAASKESSNDFTPLTPSNETNAIAQQSATADATTRETPRTIDGNALIDKGSEADIAASPEPTQITEKTQNHQATTDDVVTSLVAAEDLTEELIQDEGAQKSWTVLPVAGPVYHNSLSQGSVFDPSFSDNTRQGDLTFSYGLRLNLKLDKRLQLRTGINSVAMGYTTKGIEIATGPAAYGLSAVTYENNRNVISVFDKGTLPSNPNADPTNPYNQLSLKSSGGDLSLRANINYLEFPLELSYALIDQKVQLSLISGVSGLLLSNNEVSVNDGDNRYVLGSLNNLNDFSFSTNIGVGLNYALFEGFNLQLEPTFKYQLGTYNDASVDFSPYQLVLLSGLQFQF